MRIEHAPWAPVENRSACPRALPSAPAACPGTTHQFQCDSGDRRRSDGAAFWRILVSGYFFMATDNSRPPCVSIAGANLRLNALVALPTPVNARDQGVVGLFELR